MINKMNLTTPRHPAILCPIRPHDELGSRNPVSKGDETPQLEAVFFCLSFCAFDKFIKRSIHIMMGLFGQSLRLVVPLHDFSTPFNPVTSVVENIDDGFTTFSKGITA